MTAAETGHLVFGILHTQDALTMDIAGLLKHAVENGASDLHLTASSSFASEQGSSRLREESTV